MTLANIKIYAALGITIFCWPTTLGAFTATIIEFTKRFVQDSYF